MTTNITPLEALEKMKILFFNIKGCTHSTSGQPNKRAYELAKEGQDIATQTLAPQEPQQKTFTQYEVRDILNEVLLDYLDKPSVDAYRLDVLKKLEKAVE